MGSERIVIPTLRFLANHPRLNRQLFRFAKDGNPFDPSFASDPYSNLHRDWPKGRVFFSKRNAAWNVIGYGEARQILTSPSTSVSSQINIFLAGPSRRKLSPATVTFLSKVLIIVDPPEHTRLRRIVASAFSPAQITRLEPVVAQLVDTMLLEVADDRAPDLVPSIISPLPITIISELLGLPEDRRTWLREISDEITKLFSPFQQMDPARVDAAIADLSTYIIQLADERRLDPRDDLISALVRAEDVEGRLSRDELVTMVGMLMFAGHETTNGLLGNAIAALAKHPDQRTKLLENPSLWPNAIEELIRYDTSVQLALRKADEDIEIAGVTIPKGANIFVELGSANRDPNRFDDPDALIIDRSDPRPISFGHGIHHCLGAALARLELRIALPAIVEAFGDYTIEADDVGEAALPVPRTDGVARHPRPHGLRECSLSVRCLAQENRDRGTRRRRAALVGRRGGSTGRGSRKGSPLTGPCQSARPSTCPRTRGQ